MDLITTVSELEEKFNSYRFNLMSFYPIEEFDIHVILYVYFDDWNCGSIKKGDKIQLSQTEAEIIDIRSEKGEYILTFLIRV